MVAQRLEDEPGELDGSLPHTLRVTPRDMHAKVLRSEEWWSRELQRRLTASEDASGLTVPPPRARGRGYVDVTYWGPLDTGDYDVGTRGPHRHGFNELLWTRAGAAVHDVDGRRIQVGPGSLLLIRRDQVHDYREAQAVSGTALRFDEDLLRLAADPSWSGPRIKTAIAHVPADHVDYLESVCELLFSTRVDAERETADPQHLTDLHSSLLHSLLLLFSRWQDEYRPPAPEVSAAWHTTTARRFRELLEEHFAEHHDVGFYAAQLAVGPASLRRLLVEMTGSSTKELILDRVMVEAVRLLRFSDASVAEIATAVGFRDALYFSRAFKRMHGCSPTAFRSGVTT